MDLSTIPCKLALVSESRHVTAAQLAKVSAALSVQVQRDFSPVWQISATVDPFPTTASVPAGYWPVIIKDDINEPGAAGYHTDNNGQPYSLVQYDPQWSLTASHEALEMLGDPFGNRLVAGRTVKPGQSRTKRVKYLVEVCDPSESEQFAYTIDNVLVSDFYTPHYHDPVQVAGVRYSFTGAIKKPRQVLPGGYLSWINPATNHFEQETWFGGNNPQYTDLGPADATMSLREFVDRNTDVPK